MKMIVQVFGALAIGCAAAAGPGLAAAEIQIAERVFLVRDSASAPTEFQMIVNAGSADEAGGVSRGVAHYLEHLILVGRNAENADIALRFLPDARSNGWTSQRATAYTHSVPARAQGPRETLEKLFAFYAARLRDFEISLEDALRERNVVLQEHDWRLGSSASARFARLIDVKLFRNHPFGQWPIGERAAIAELQIEDARAFHRAWYHINNVWFVIKSDIEPQELRQIAMQHLGALAPARLPVRPRAAPVEISPGADHVLTRDLQAGVTAIAYRKLFAFNESDALSGRAVATVLSNILATQLPGSLYDALVERQKLAHEAPGISISRLETGVYQLSINVRPAPGVADSSMLDAISAYVAGLAKLVVSDRNIIRIKTRLADARAADDGEPSRVYRRLVSWLAAGYAYQELSIFPARLEAVTREEISALAGAAAGRGWVVSGVLSPGEPTR